MKRNLLRSSWVGALVTEPRIVQVAGDYNRVYGADAHFQFYQRLEFDSYLLASDTPGLAGQEPGAAIPDRLARRRILGQRANTTRCRPTSIPRWDSSAAETTAQYQGDVSWQPQLQEQRY